MESHDRQRNKVINKTKKRCFLHASSQQQQHQKNDNNNN